MKSIRPEEINENIFNMIGNKWMLVTGKKDDKVNAMTASWGGAGIMWGKPVVFVFIRESRYTKEFVDDNCMFSLGFFPENEKKMLGYMGSVSGRNEDKIEKSALKYEIKDDGVIFEKADMTIICKKMYQQEMEKNCFTDNEAYEKWYENGDMHTMYVAEIKDILVK